MTQWTYVLAAYAVTLTGTGWLLATSWAAARKAEREADALANETGRR